MKKVIFLLSLSILLQAQSPSATNNLNFYGGFTQGVRATLALPVITTDLSVSVINGTCFSYGNNIPCTTAFYSNQIVTLDNENMMVCSVVVGPGQTTILNIGQATCPSMSGRGIGGTTIAQHFGQVTSILTSYSYNQILSTISNIQITTPSNNVIISNTGIPLSSTINSSVLIGHGAGRSATSGGAGVLIGDDACESLLIINDHVCIGFAAGDSLTTGQRATLIGDGAYKLGNGNAVFAEGWSALNNAYGDNLYASGYESQASLCLGLTSIACNNATENTSNGFESMSSLINNTGNTCQGFGCQEFGINQARSTCQGDQCQGGSRGGIGTGLGDDNVCQGRFCEASYLFSGNRNVTQGNNTLVSATTANDNSIQGDSAGQNLTSGSAHVISGSGALGAATIATKDTCQGYLCFAVLTASANQCAGAQCYVSATSATELSGMGYQIGVNCTTCANITLSGFASGGTITTGNNIALYGDNTDVDLGTASFRTAIGSFAIAKQDNSITLGRSSDALIFGGGTSINNANIINNQCYLLLTSNTSMTLNCKGSDGTVRSIAFTLM